MAKLIVNGEDQEVQLPATVADLIKQNNVAQPEMVSVQVNEEFVDREEFATLQLNEGDAVDFLYFMGGGQDKESIEYRFGRLGVQCSAGRSRGTKTNGQTSSTKVE